MKSKKKFVLAGLFLLAAITMVLLPLAGCKNDTVPEPTAKREAVKVLSGYTSPNHTDGSWTYVAFGEWPQSIKSDSVTVDESESKQVGMFTYYKGSDGAWYVNQEEKAWQSDYTYSDKTPVGQDGTTTKWFKVEPIVWRVLTENYNSTGTALLLAEKILTGGVPYYVDTNQRTITGAGTDGGGTPCTPTTGSTAPSVHGSTASTRAMTRRLKLTLTPASSRRPSPPPLRI